MVVFTTNVWKQISFIVACFIFINNMCFIRQVLRPRLTAGGATWLMQVTDNGKLIHRRGRWQNYNGGGIDVVIFAENPRAEKKF